MKCDEILKTNVREGLHAIKVQPKCSLFKEDTKAQRRSGKASFLTWSNNLS